MADIRIKDLTTTASSTASDDFIAVDGTTNGTRKLNAFSPTFGGNATVTGTLTVNGASTFNATVLISSNVGTIGKSGSGTGGNWRFITDDGTTRWLAGILGGAGETSFDLYDIVNGRSLLTLTSAGVVKVPQTTASTTTSTGALVVSGGVGVAGAITAGGTLRVIGSSQIIRVRHDAATIDFTNTAQDAYVAATVIGNTLQLSGNNGNGILIGATGIATVQATTASTSTSSGALVVSGGVGVAGNTNIGGVASVGGSSNSAVGIYVINTALTGTDQYGVASEPIWTSTANLGHTIWARTKTAASAFTLTSAHAFFVEQPTLGAGSSITNIYGMRIRNQGTTGVTNAYGLYVESQSGAATVNYAIYTAGGRINFQGLPTSSAGLPAGTLWNDGGTLKVA